MYRSTLFCLIAGMLFACQISNADDITIPAGTTVTTEVTVPVGDNLSFNGTSTGSPTNGINGLGANRIEVGTSGLISGATTNAIATQTSGSQTTVLIQRGTIRNSADDAIDLALDGSSVTTVRNYGLIENSNSNAFNINPDQNSRVMVYNYGTLRNSGSGEAFDMTTGDDTVGTIYNYGPAIGFSDVFNIDPDDNSIARIYNYGVIQNTTSNAFDFDSDDFSTAYVYNYGTIRDSSGIVIDLETDNFSTIYFYNYGTILNSTSEVFDIEPDDDSSTFVYNYGFISNSSEGIDVDANERTTVEIHNYGTFNNQSGDGFNLYADDTSAVRAFNYGTISNSGDDGVELDPNTNSSISFFHSGYILNSGDYGIFVDTGIADITIQSGVIRGSGNAQAISLSSGDDTLNLSYRPAIENIIDGGADTDTLNIRARGLTQADINSVNALNGPAQQTFTLHGESFTIQNFENFTFDFEQYADLLPSDCFGDLGSRLDNTTGYSEEFRLYYGALDMTPAGTMLQDYVNNFTGRSTAGAMAFSSLDESLVFSDTLLHRVYPAARPVGPANDEDPWTFWVSGRNSTLEQGRNKFQGAYSYRSETGTFGADYRKSENCTLGFLASYTTARSTTDSFGSNYEEDVMRFAVYGTHTNGPWFFDGLLGYSSHDYDTARAIGIPTGFYQATSQLGGSMAYGGTSGDQFSSYIRAGYDFEIGEGDNPWVLTPLAGLHYYGLSVNDFSESGSFANLRFNDLSAESFRTQLSLLLSKTHHFDNGAWIRPSLYASWYYDALDDPGSYNASIEGSGLGNFGVDLYRGNCSLLLAGISLFAAPTGNDNFNVFFNWGVESGADDFTSHNVSGGIRLQFD